MVTASTWETKPITSRPGERRFHWMAASIEPGRFRSTMRRREFGEEASWAGSRQRVMGTAAARAVAAMRLENIRSRTRTRTGEFCAAGVLGAITSRALSLAGAFDELGAVSSRAISLAGAASRGVSVMRPGVTVRRGDGNGWSNNVHPGGDP